MTTLLPIIRGSDALSEVAALSGQNLYACYQCGKCTAGCPFSFSPQQVVRHLQLGQVAQALALDTTWECASCFTCTAACPKGVDPARIMRALRSLPPDRIPPPVAEGAERNGAGTPPPDPLPTKHGNRRRAWVFANNHRIARLGSRLAPVSNWLLKVPGAGLAAHHLLGIHKERSLPPFARPTFPAWFRGHTPAGDGHRGDVLLFHDTFMDFNFPEAGIAATELLERAGFRVALTDTVCCGRPMISKGFTEQAERHARTNLSRLYEHARQGTYIVGCEPSCLLTLRGEYAELVREPELKEKARVVGRQALLIDEFLAMLSRQGELELTFDHAPNGGRPVLLHAHCHQKAVADPGASMELLRLAGYEAELVNAACCGMAGAFGYEKEHYALSRAAGEKGVLPAVRAREDAEVVVLGVSCRQQIEHFTGRRTLHLAQALRDAAAPAGEDGEAPDGEPAGALAASGSSAR
jgi:Fe-S oxidoreductase